MRRVAYLCSLLVAGSLIVDVAVARPGSKVEVRPFFGARLGGNINNSTYDSDDLADELIDDLSIKGGSQYGVSVSIPISLLGAIDRQNRLQMEFFVSTGSSTLRLDTRDDIDFDSLPGNFKSDGDKIELFDLDVTYIHIGGLYQWSHLPWVPYVNAGFGATIFSPDGDLDSRTEFSLGLGGGIKKYFTRNIGIRSQIRGLATFLGTRGETIYCDAFGCWAVEDNVTLSQLEFSTGLVFAF